MAQATRVCELAKLVLVTFKAFNQQCGGTGRHHKQISHTTKLYASQTLPAASIHRDYNVLHIVICVLREESNKKVIPDLHQLLVRNRYLFPSDSENRKDNNCRL